MDVPLDNINYDDLNDPSKTWVRRYFIALCKETLGRVRGTFGGKIPVPDANMEIEYQSLLSEGKDEMITLKKELEDRMFKLNPLEILKRKLVVTWWTNIRFEKSFTKDLCTLLKASGLIAGDPKDEKTFVGPMISEGEAARLEGWVKEAEEAGGTVAGFNAATDPLFGREIIAANPHIFKKAQSILSNSGL